MEKSLDLFLTTNHTLVDSVSIIPGLSDHNIVKCTVNSKPRVAKKLQERPSSTEKLTGPLLMYICNPSATPSCQVMRVSQLRFCGQSLRRL